MNIDDTIEELILFSNTILELGEPVGTQLIDDFEKKFNIKLPNDYRFFLSKHNGATLLGTSIYGILPKDSSNSLEGNYIFEHNEVGNEMYAYLVPFSPDGGGNHYCFDSRFHNQESCPVVFWQHDYNYSEDDMPEVTNESFVSWVKEVMIDWTLEEYEYDGTKR